MHQEDEVEILIALATQEGRAAEEARQAMTAHARHRQAAMLCLSRDHGLSIREIARRSGCSPSVVQKLLRVANRVSARQF